MRSTVVKFGQTARRVKRVHTLSGTIVRSGKGWRRATAKGLPKTITNLAESNITDSGKTVLGHFPGYIDKARARGALRAEVRDIWQSVTGRRAIWDELQVHHRIPIEWSHVFERADPNRLSNLVGVNSATHVLIGNEWAAWRRALRGRVPTQTEVMKQALKIDKMFPTAWVFSK